MNKTRRRQALMGRRLVVICLCVAFIGTTIWFISAIKTDLELQTVIEDKEALLKSRIYY